MHLFLLFVHKYHLCAIKRANQGTKVTIFMEQKVSSNYSSGLVTEQIILHFSMQICLLGVSGITYKRVFAWVLYSECHKRSCESRCTEWSRKMHKV